MAEIIRAPAQWPVRFDRPYLFLGGSIEQGTAEPWQQRVIDAVSDLDVIVLDPRRDEWDASWKQDPIKDTPFYDQVTWELDGQDCSDINVYYFDPATLSPITLLELGLYSCMMTDVIVRCTKEFWRYGNVKMVCDRLDIPCFEDDAEFIAHLRKTIEAFNG